MIRTPLKRRYSIALGVLSVCLLFGAYLWLSHAQHVKNPDDTTLPNMGQLIDGLEKITTKQGLKNEVWLLTDSEATLGRLFLGLVLGIFGAMLLGLHMGCFPVVEALFMPPVSFIAKVPPTAAMAVFFVLVGTETDMFVAIIAFGIAPTLAMSIHLAVREFPNELLHKSYTLGATPMEIVWGVIFPQILPKAIDGIRLQIGPAMIFLIAAEMLVGDEGFGYRLRLQSRLLNMDVVYPYLVFLGAFGFAMDAGLRYLQRRLFPWYGGRS